MLWIVTAQTETQIGTEAEADQGARDRVQGETLPDSRVRRAAIRWDKALPETVSAMGIPVGGRIPMTEAEYTPV